MPATQVSERYLDRITRIPPHVTRPRSGEPSPGDSVLSVPDEGSIAEKEYPYNEKYSTSPNMLVEKEGFFDQESVNKELTKIEKQQGRQPGEVASRRSELPG